MVFVKHCSNFLGEFARLSETSVDVFKDRLTYHLLAITCI